MDNFDYVKNNFLSLREEIDALSSRLGVTPPTLVSVTKSGSDGELLYLAGLGAADIGENRPGELNRRGEILKNAGFCPRLHEIGTLQRNKIKLIIKDVFMIHSVDSLKLCEDINRHAEMHGRVVPILIEVNCAREAQKGGVFPEDAERLLCSVMNFENVRVSGLMTMGPASENPEETRPYFRETKKLFDRLNSSYGFGAAPTLSMGMSDSWQTALEEGSTLIRVGRRLFKR